MMALLALMFVAGWCAHILWDRLMDWLAETTEFVSGVVLDVLAAVGAGTLCYVGYLAAR